MLRPASAPQRGAPVLLVSGTRPEVIKLAPVYHALRESDWAAPEWLHTGQHDEMARPMLECFDIQPDHPLQRRGSSLIDFSVGCREQVGAVLQQRAWAAVVVQGDTESAFLGALAGFYERVPVAHVEAGLRTHTLHRPFPEEGLRQMIGRVARFHFAPTARAARVLQNEGLAQPNIWVTGNTVIDAQQWVAARYGIARRTAGRGHLLVTIHRRENWGADIEHACAAIADIARAYPSLPVLFPVHLNPVVQEPVHRLLGGLANVRLVAPLDYLAMQQALADAWLVLTDSGGLQEEAPTFKVPVLVLRDETERPEVLDAGCAALVGTDRAAIVRHVHELMHDERAYARMQAATNPFGDGSASRHIAAHLRAALHPDAPDVESRHGDIRRSPA